MSAEALKKALDASEILERLEILRGEKTCQLGWRELERMRVD